MQAIKRTYLGLIRLIALMETALCYAGLVLCSFMVFVQVLNRYLLHYEIMWIGDLTLYIFVPMMILSISLTAREGGHTSVDVFVDILFESKPLGRKIYGIFVDCLTLGVLVYVLPMGMKLFKHALKFPEYGTLVRWFNTSWIRETILVMLVLCLLHTVHRIGTQLASLRPGAGAKTTGEAQ